ncbi:MAG: hypothetical protein QG590_2000, partial [Pseudomonadota bacterium]|nr:hypothetical protein [Pseudomonadota bacterium]
EASKAASASLDKVGISAAQTAAALRGVPAQFTDIATSIAGGQAPLTVFLQQGGQLKDMFGGAGAAAKALGGYVVGLLTPLNLAVAAIGGIGYAAYSGASEMDEFKKNLVLTGNISGITTDKFNSMAAAMGNISGITRGAAAEALTAMAASGNIGSASIQKLTEAALKFEKAGGPAVAETAKQFESLGKEPLKASIELDKQTHHLTLAVYEQIKALEDQGKTSEAAAVAQNAWADVLEQRTPQMVANIGRIEKAWATLKKGAAGAFDDLKSIGRTDALDVQAADLHAKIGNIESTLQRTVHSATRINLQQEKRKLITELQALYVEIRKTHKEESDKTEEAAKKEAAKAANIGADAIIDSQRSKRERHAAELKKLDDQRAKELITEEKYQQAKAALAKKYEEKPASAPKRTEAEKELARLAKLDAEESARRIANAQRVGAEMNKETEAIWAKVEAENAAREAIGLSKSGIESRTLAIMQEQLAWRDALGLEDEQTEQLKRNIAAQRALVDAAVSREATQGSFDSAKQAAKDVEEAHKKAAEEAAREWQKTVDTIDGTFHDAFTDMLKQGEADWESFADSLATTFKSAVADEIYKMTLKPLVLNVVGSFSGAGATAVPGADGQSLSVSNGFGVLSGVQSAYGAVNGGITNAASSFATSGMGQYLGLSTVAPAGYTMGPPTAAGAYGYTAGGAAMTGSGSTLSAVAAPATAALIGTYLMAEMAKAGWGMDNNRSAGGAYASNPYLYMAYQAGSRLFGHNRNISPDAGGIQGVLDTSGFTGDRWQQFSQRGGTFRSDKRWTDTFELDSDIDSYLDSLMRQTVSQLQAIGKTLDVETVRAVDGFSHQFSLQLSENGSWEKAGEKIAGEMAKVSDELVKSIVPNLADLSLFGETATQTFTRLGQEVAATDAILLAMGKNAAEAFGGVGLASIAAREHLIDLAGGLESLASKTQSYYANFYSSEEQVQLAATQAQKVLTEGFAELGQSTPATREAFRSLVESQDLSTEAGRKLWNSLLDLQDEFDAVADGADATASKLKEATTTAQQGQASLFDVFATDSQKLAAAHKLINDAFAGLGKSVPATAGDFLDLAKAIDPATEAGQSLIATLQKVSGAFSYVEKSAADSAAAKVAAAQAASQAAAQAAQEAAQAATQSSGSRRSIQDQFDPAGAVTRAQADIGAAFAKYGASNLIPTTREGVAQLAGTIDVNSALGQEQMAALQSLSGAFDAVFGAQESAARSAADAAKQAADEQARLAQQAADAAQRAAEDQMRAAQRAADEQMRLANQVHDSISGALRSLLGQSEQFEDQSRQMAQATLQSALVIAKAGGSLTNFQGLDAALASVNKLDKATFATAAGYAVEFGRTANLLTQLEQYTRINGSHASGLDYVPFDGYVAQLHRGERVQTASSAAAADATVEEVKALRSDLNAIGAALASYTQKTAKLMAKFDVEGIPARV